MKTNLLCCVGALLIFSSCYARVVSTGYGYSDSYPPDAYIATATPYYYEGYPTYWYGGQWYRREPRGWHVYRTEPLYLQQLRVRGPAPVYRQSYGRGQYYGNVRNSRGNYHGAAPVRGHR